MLRTRPAQLSIRGKNRDHSKLNLVRPPNRMRGHREQTQIDSLQ